MKKTSPQQNVVTKKKLHLVVLKRVGVTKWCSKKMCI